MNPLNALTEQLADRRTAAAGARAKRNGAPNDPEQYLRSLGYGIPDRLRVEPLRAQTELVIAEQTETSLRLQQDTTARELTKQPSKHMARVKTVLLYLVEIGGLYYLFAQELGYPPLTSLLFATLYTSGIFATTKCIYENINRPPHERAPYWKWLFAVFLIGGISLVALRLGSANATGESLMTTIATSIVLAFVTLLPGWLAAKEEVTLDAIHEAEAAHESVSLEFHQATVRVAGLRHNIYATTPDDLQLLDDRDRLAALWQQGYDYEQVPGSTSGAR
jgi:hypothetical protein